MGEGWGHGEDREGQSRQRETDCDGREGSRDRGLMKPKADEERRAVGGRLCLDRFPVFKSMASDDHGHA